MLTRAPFVGIVLFCISGILLADWLMSFLDMNQSFVISMCLFAAASSVFCYFKKQKVGFGMCFSMFLIALAVFCKVECETQRELEISQLQNADYSAYEAVIRSLPEKRSNSVRLEATITRVKSDIEWINVDTKSLISIDSESDIIPRPGDRLVVSGTLDRPLEALNPGQFDYRNYLRNKDILWTDYLQPQSFQVISNPNEQRNPAFWSTMVSEWADKQFRKNIGDDKAYGLVKAMLLGRRDDLENDLVSDYVASGTVHILSVSGMHVAIIFLVITFLLGWIKKWKYGRFLYLALVIALLGFYAIITGMPPSVQRATLMCIVFVVAEVFSRKHNTMNTLAVSAMLILLFDPSALYDVGFQLSYLAMTGIFLFYEPILALFNTNNRVTKFVWQISALAFAAQLTTFPLSLYYFHQFPSYFWLVNPFVILFTNILLPAAIVMLFVSILNVAWMQLIVNKVVFVTAWLTNYSVAIPKLLPGYLVENLHLDQLEVILLFVLLVFIWYAIHAREYVYVKYAASTVLLLVTYSLSASIGIYLSSNHVVHHIPKHSVVSFKHGNSLYIASDKSFVSDQRAYDFYVKNHAINQEVSNVIYAGEKSK
jgi:competence protein ComEC